MCYSVRSDASRVLNKRRVTSSFASMSLTSSRSSNTRAINCRRKWRKNTTESNSRRKNMLTVGKRSTFVLNFVLRYWVLLWSGILNVQMRRLRVTLGSVKGERSNRTTDTRPTYPRRLRSIGFEAIATCVTSAHASRVTHCRRHSDATRNFDESWDR